MVTTVITGEVSNEKKRTMKLSKYLFIIILFVVSCDQEGTLVKSPAAGCAVRVKVLVSVCSHIVLEIQDANYNYLGDPDWRTRDGRATKPTFQVDNFCGFHDSIKEGDILNKEFDVVLTSEAENSCGVCTAVYEGDLPNRSWDVVACRDAEKE
jgi:hypothetical protein